MRLKIYIDEEPTYLDVDFFSFVKMYVLSYLFVLFVVFMFFLFLGMFAEFIGWL